MQARDTAGDQLLSLPGSVFNSGLKLSFCALPGSLEGPGKRLWQPRLAEAGNPLDLLEVGDRHEAGHDRLVNANGRTTIAEAKEVSVVVKKLSHHDIAAGVTLLLEECQVGFGADCFLVGFGIACYKNGKRRKFITNQGNKFGGILQPVSHWSERRFTLRRISSQRNNGRDASLLSCAEILTQLGHGSADAGQVTGHGDARVATLNAIEHIERLLLR